MFSLSVKSQLLSLLDRARREDPDKPISFVALGKQLGVSRQYAHVLYHQLEKDYTLPPVGIQGFGSMDLYKKADIASRELDKAHKFTSKEASRAGKIRWRKRGVKS